MALHLLAVTEPVALFSGCALAGSTLTVAAMLRLRAQRALPGAHRRVHLLPMRPATGTHHREVADAPQPPGAPVDADAAPEADEPLTVAALAAPAVAQQSPTGELVSAGTAVPTSMLSGRDRVNRVNRGPATRVATAGAAPVRARLADPAEDATGSAAVLGGVGAATLNVAVDPDQATELLRNAWDIQDPEALAALAARVPDLCATAAVLAAACSPEGSPARLVNLTLALAADTDLDTDPALEPYRASLSFALIIPCLDLTTQVPPTRAGVALAAASAELAAEDPAAAYDLLAPADLTPLTGLVRAHLELQLGLTSRAARTARTTLDASQDNVHRAALQVLLGQAQTRAGNTGAALVTLTEALTALPDDGELALLARMTRAQAALADGDGDSAWADLTAVLASHPDHGPAAELLKTT